VSLGVRLQQTSTYRERTVSTGLCTSENVHYSSVCVHLAVALAIFSLCLATRGASPFVVVFWRVVSSATHAPPPPFCALCVPSLSIYLLISPLSAHNGWVLSRTLLRSRGFSTAGLQGQGSIVDTSANGRFLIGIPIEVKLHISTGG
jgi:hypothetical protein